MEIQKRLERVSVSNQHRAKTCKRCLIDDEEMYHNMVRIGHTHHQLETIEALKKSLSPYNDKKWIKKNGNVFKIYSLGHDKISYM